MADTHIIKKQVDGECPVYLDTRDSDEAFRGEYRWTRSAAKATGYASYDHAICAMNWFRLPADCTAVPAKGEQQRVIQVRTKDELLCLSYYTLCKLCDKTKLNVLVGLPGAIERGEWKGKLTLDSLDNYVDFE